MRVGKTRPYRPKKLGDYLRELKKLLDRYDCYGSLSTDILAKAAFIHD